MEEEKNNDNQDLKTAAPEVHHHVLKLMKLENKILAMLIGAITIFIVIFAVFAVYVSQNGEQPTNQDVALEQSTIQTTMVDCEELNIHSQEYFDNCDGDSDPATNILYARFFDPEGKYELIMGETVVAGRTDDPDPANRQLLWKLNIWKIDSSGAGEKIAEVPTGLIQADTGEPVTVNSDGSFALVSPTGSNEISHVNLKTGEVKTIFTGKHEVAKAYFTSVEDKIMVISSDYYNDEGVLSQIVIIDSETGETLEEMEVLSGGPLDYSYWFDDENRALLSGCWGSEAIKCHFAEANFNTMQVTSLNSDDMMSVGPTLGITDTPYALGHGDNVPDTCTAFWSDENIYIYDEENELVAKPGIKGTAVSFIAMSPRFDSVLLSSHEVTNVKNPDYETVCEPLWEAKKFYVVDLKTNTSTEVDPLEQLKEWMDNNPWNYERIDQKYESFIDHDNSRNTNRIVPRVYWINYI